MADKTSFPIFTHVAARDNKFTTKNKMFADEFREFIQSSSKFFQTFQTKKNRSSEYFIAAQEMQSVTSHNKHNVKPNGHNTEFNHKTPPLSKKERNKFCKWFTTRIFHIDSVSKPTPTREIPIQYVIDDFIKTGLFQCRADAFVFLSNFDTEHTGMVSMGKLVDRFYNTTDSEHVLILREFISHLEEPSDTLRNLDPTFISRSFTGDFAI